MDNGVSSFDGARSPSDKLAVRMLSGPEIPKEGPTNMELRGGSGIASHSAAAC